MDKLTPERRSWNMSRIRSRDTRPEVVVRSTFHRLGARFRLHRKDLPGTPDIVLPRYGLVVFVHGCFWHRHEACRFAYNPKSRIAFWRQKFRANVDRDRANIDALRAGGWTVEVVWECETRDVSALEERLGLLLRRQAVDQRIS